MSRQSKPDTEPDDTDLAALFEAQSHGPPGQPPAELDELIVSAARSAVETETTERKRRDHATRTTLGKRVTGWFAVAATLVIGVSVAPLLLKAPESALDFQTPETVLEAAPEATPAAPMADPQPVTQAADAEISPAGAALKREQPLSTQSMQMEVDAVADAVADTNISQDAAKTANFAAERSLGNSEEESTSDSAEQSLGDAAEKILGGSAGDQPEYRNAVDSWLDEIQNLMNDENNQAAREEFKLFRAAHPNVEVNAEIDALKPSEQ